MCDRCGKPVDSDDPAVSTCEACLPWYENSEHRSYDTEEGRMARAEDAADKGWAAYCREEDLKYVADTEAGLWGEHSYDCACEEI